MTHFISIEGGEGVGKSSFAEGLTARMQLLGLPLIRTHEPGGTPVAQRIREIFLHPPSDDSLVAEAELFLIAAARAQHVSRLIKPTLERGQWVLCDRFYDSTRVYQGVLAGVDSELLEMSINYAVGGCHPELTFVLDCDSKVAKSRLATRAGQADEEHANRYDGARLEIHERMRQGFQDLASRYPQRIVLLDASQALDVVIESALTEVKRRFLES